MNKPILVACDHAAVEMKKEVIKHLEDQGYTCVDFGTHTSASCNYPDYAEKVCTAIYEGEGDMGGDCRGHRSECDGADGAAGRADGPGAGGGGQHARRVAGEIRE